MTPTMIWVISLFMGAVYGVDPVVVRSITLTPEDYSADGIGVEFGESCSSCTCDDTRWYTDESSIDDWAVEVQLDSVYALSDGLSSITFELTGERVHDNKGDLFMGFGDGEKYIALGVDFDGGFGNGGTPSVQGIQVYPECGGSLGTAAGDITEILSVSNSEHNTLWKRLRDALAGGNEGDRDNWRQLGNEEFYNGNNWPVTIDIVNNADDDEVTFRFSSSSDSIPEDGIQCVFDGAFGAGNFAYGVIADAASGLNDDFYIDSIKVTTTNSISGSCQDESEPTSNLLCDPTLWSELAGDWTHDADACTLAVGASDEDSFMWFGSDDGLISCDAFGYNDAEFELTAIVSFQSVETTNGQTARLLFRANEISDDSHEYYEVALWKDQPSFIVDVVFFADYPWPPSTALGSGGYDFELDTEYTITVHAEGDVYSIYVDGTVVETLEEFTATTYSTGTIGLATSRGTTFHSLIYQAGPFSDGFGEESNAMRRQRESADTPSVIDQSVADTADYELFTPLVTTMVVVGVCAISILALLMVKQRLQKKAATITAQEEHIPEISASAVAETAMATKEVEAEDEAKPKVEMEVGTV